MKIGIMTYPSSPNIGDHIQSLAVKQHVKDADVIYVDRDSLASYDGEDCVVVLNGWFSAAHDCFPPSAKITPVFFGFHMTDDAVEPFKAHLDYFKRHEPIGCRDAGTMEILKGWGVDAYVSGCATMTFPKRTSSEKGTKNYIVNVAKRYFPKADRKNFVPVSQDIGLSMLSEKTKLDIAAELLAIYRDTARFVITSRIHCALPCSAMGIPTLYVGRLNRRTAAINHIGVPVSKLRLWWRKPIADLMVGAPDYEDKKSAMIADLKAKLQRHGVAIA